MRELSLKGAKNQKGLIGAAIFAIMTIYIFSISSFLVHCHRMFYTFFDLALFDQIFWNFLQGNWFQTSLENCNNFLGIHFSPILVLLIPIYAIRQSPITLMVARTVLIAMGCLPAYWISRRLFEKRFIPLLFSAFYLFNPLVVKINLENHFNPIGLLLPILMFALHFLFEKRFFPFIAFCILACLVKEDIPLTIAFLGLYVAFFMKKWRLGACIALFSVLYFIFAIKILIPHFAQSEIYDVRAGNGFDYLGEGVGGIITGILQNPLTVLKMIISREKMIYIFVLLFTFSFLPLLRPSLLIPAIPALTIILIGQSDTLTSIFSRYSTPLAPFVFVATIAGLSKCKSYFIQKKARWKLVVYSLLILLFCCSFMVHLLYPEFKPRYYPHAENSRKIISAICKDCSVTATQNFLPHLSHRRRLFDITHEVKTDIVVLETNPNHWITHKMAGEEAYQKAIQNIMNDPSLKPVREFDGILLYERIIDK